MVKKIPETHKKPRFVAENLLKSKFYVEYFKTCLSDFNDCHQFM